MKRRVREAYCKVVQRVLIMLFAEDSRISMLLNDELNKAPDADGLAIVVFATIESY